MLPTAVNLHHWCIQSNVKCTLCDSIQPTTYTARILGGCPVALSQQLYTYCHNQVLHILVSKLTALFADHQDVRVYADLNTFCFNESPQETISLTVLITPYHPDFIISVLFLGKVDEHKLLSRLSCSVLLIGFCDPRF